MKLTKQQQNCPYCHPGSNIPCLGDGSPWSNNDLEFERVSDTRVTVGDDTWGEIDFNPIDKTLTSWGEGTDPLVVDINCCPFCGRPLNEEVKDD